MPAWDARKLAGDSIESLRHRLNLSHRPRFNPQAATGVAACLAAGGGGTALRSETAPQEPSRFVKSRFSLGEGGRRDGLSHVCWVGDLDLAGLGLLGYGDGEREHAVLVAGGDVVTV